MECIHCLLTDSFPTVRILEDGLCNLCHYERDHPIDTLALRRQTLDFVQDLCARHEKVIVGLSGGKDSSATLVWLKQQFPTLPLRAVTVDNGFCAEEALVNIHNLVDRLQVPWELIPMSLDTAMLHAYSTRDNFCVPCAHAYMRILGKRAIELDSTTIVLGREWLYAHDVTTGQIVRYDPVHDGYPYTGIEGTTIIRLLAGLSMTIAERYALLDTVGWKQPNIPGNTNCLILGLVSRRFMDCHGYHPFILPISEQIRRGMLSREQARSMLAKPDLPAILESTLATKLAPYDMTTV